MSLFRWRKSNAIFVPAIDKEHQTIFEETAAFQEALDAGTPQAELREILHRLLAATEEHFAHEEKLMRSSRYLSFDWHRRQHETARKRLSRYAPLVEQGDREAGRELVEFLSGWLDDHTKVTDRMMAAHLRNQERAQTR